MSVPLTQRQVAEILDVTVQRVQQLDEKGDGPPRDFNGKYPGKALGDWMRQKFAAAGDKGRLVKAQADIAEMEAAEMRGDLVRRAEVEKDYGESVIASRARILLVGPLLAPKLAAPGKVAEVQSMIQDALYEALDELARMGPPDVAVDEAVESTAETDGQPVGGSEPQA